MTTTQRAPLHSTLHTPDVNAMETPLSYTQRLQGVLCLPSVRPRMPLPVAFLSHLIVQVAAVLGVGLAGCTVVASASEFMVSDSRGARDVTDDRDE